MSKKTHSVGLNFEKQFGKGTDPLYANAERWVKIMPIILNSKTHISNILHHRFCCLVEKNMD